MKLETGKGEWVPGKEQARFWRELVPKRMIIFRSLWVSKGKEVWKLEEPPAKLRFNANWRGVFQRARTRTISAEKETTFG